MIWLLRFLFDFLDMKASENTFEHCSKSLHTPAQEVNSYLQYPKERSSPASWMDMAIRAPDRYASPWASVMKFDTRTINNEWCIHGPWERTEEVLFQTAHRVFLYIRVILYYPELNIICDLCHIEKRDTNTCVLLVPGRHEWPVWPETYS